MFLSFLFFFIGCEDSKENQDETATSGNRVNTSESNVVENTVNRESSTNNNCGPASITELKTNCAQTPKWLSSLFIRTEEELVSVDAGGEVIWHDGTWLKGTWHGGTWHNGSWGGGTWKGGIWEDGWWKNGLWLKGTWYAGKWDNGTWLDGRWRGGHWFDGTHGEEEYGNKDGGKECLKVEILTVNT